MCLKRNQEVKICIESTLDLSNTPRDTFRFKTSILLINIYVIPLKLINPRAAAAGKEKLSVRCD